MKLNFVTEEELANYKHMEEWDSAFVDNQFGVALLYTCIVSICCDHRAFTSLCKNLSSAEDTTDYNLMVDTIGDAIKYGLTPE